MGFAGAPLWLGVDQRGRDTLSYLPGRVAQVDDRLSDAQLSAAGRLLRSFHDATRGSPLAGDQETVCHHDAGPYNMVFGEDGLPYALVDFDLAGPDSALEDVAYAAWLCCINSRWLRRAPLAEQARQLRAFADSYALEGRERGALLDVVDSRQLDMMHWAHDFLARSDGNDRLRAHAARTLLGCQREHSFMLANRDAFENALR